MKTSSTFIVFLKQSFYIRMIVLMLIVSAIPLITLAYMAVNVSTNMFKADVNKLNYQIVAQLADRINLTMTRLQQLSYHYAMLNPIQNALQSPSNTFADFVRKKELITTLDSGIAVMGDIQSLSLYSREDRHIISSNESYSPIAESQYNAVMSHFIGAKETFMFFDRDMTAVDNNLLHSSSLFVRTIPIGSVEDYKGVIVFAVQNSLFEKLLKNIQLGAKASAYVLTPGLHVIASIGPSPEEAENGTIEPIIAKWRSLNMPNQFVYENTLVSINQSDVYHRWIVLSAIPLEEAMSSTKAIGRTVFYMLGLLLLLGFVIVFGAGYYLYKPLQSVKRQVNAIKQGQFDVRVPIRAHNEIGELGTMLNSMAAKLQSLMSELKETEQLKRRSEIRALQSQINPHFIYNSLNTISMFAMLKDYSKIKEIMTRLTSLLRYSMDNLEQTVPIREEIDYLHDYIHMLQLRYDCAFHLRADIELGLDGVYIPKLLLQPMIENAIFHGILAKETSAGTIRMAVKTAADDTETLIIEIRDDGIGMTPQRVRQMELQLSGQTVEEHIGLSNVWERVKLFYGHESSIELESRISHGTTIRIRIPKNKVQIGNELDGIVKDGEDE